ncbi:MAG: tRNA preQ1(34) S-adenosylmethionine ribosyltransferase-isomerase QueA [Patescibacteria group bacterium]|jgi:S-adenosylmethionine:tRNA ribosyltransferase-isomerase
MPKPKFRLNNFSYNLNKELIAQSPASPRDSSRLLVLDKKTGVIKHDRFYNLPKYLKPTDVLVFNDTKVIPARLHGRKKTGGKIEIFLLRKITEKKWECLTKGKIKNGQEIFFKKGFIGKMIQREQDRTKIIKFSRYNPRFKTGGYRSILSIGETPTPPYIKKQSNLKEYQTIYAKKDGSVAAPTAGFHFTKRLLRELKKRGVQMEYVTLHVGLGTFAPVKIEDITKHKMHSEYASIDKATSLRLQKAKKEKRRIIAVGTTSVRTLEALDMKHSSQWTDIFIYPGYKFKHINAMVTNFHLPESTLLMLVSAFAGSANIKTAYQQAIKKKYRFYSFGDAMFIC